MDSLKVLEPEGPIREADMHPTPNRRINPAREHRSSQPIIIGRKASKFLKSL
jgi:hypothetical protein